MSIVEARTCEMTCVIRFTEREVKMLAWLAGYGADQIAKAITEKLTKEYSKEEWEKLWQELRDQLERAKKNFHDTRQVFTGMKRAADLEK